MPKRAGGGDGFIITVRGERQGFGKRVDLRAEQRQCIAIAASLLVNLLILILDDERSAIDVKVEERIDLSLRAHGGVKPRRTIATCSTTAAIGAAADQGWIVADGLDANRPPTPTSKSAEASSDEQAAVELVR